MVAKLEKSKFGIMIRHDNGLVKVFESKFERELGDILTVDGVKYKVCSLQESLFYAKGFLGTYGSSWVFKFFNFNTPTGNNN